MDHPASGSDLQRGILLREQGRHAEAAGFLGKAIEADPEFALPYYHLASCYNEWPGHASQAIQAIDRAIQLDPGNANMHGMKGWILVCQKKYPAALKVANEAVALGPTNISALNALTNAYTKLGRWKEAEGAARRILALWPHDIPALNLLAQALRLQGRDKESREIVAGILARLPNNAFGHTNAGYGALQAGDHVRANEHFLQALRMEPHSDFARRGLVHSLRARMWIFRWHYRVVSLARQPVTFRRVLFLGMIFAGIGLLLLGEENTDAAGFVVGVCLAYFYLSCFSRIIIDMFLLFDPVGKHALNSKEKWLARFAWLAVALCVIPFLLVGYWGYVLLILGGLALFGGSVLYPQLKDRWDRMRRVRCDP